MKASEIEDISSLSETAFASLKRYQALGNDTDRRSTLKQLDHLTRALRKPADTVYQLFLSPTILMAIKIACDIGVFEVLTKTTSFVTSSELAAQKQADKILLEQIMRAVVIGGFAGERGPGQ
ncbi:hypothetical protein N8T08_002970 [Aspergillus melleus]|uniref:Uncharacterized protein n=1 Tax=Aspergillus melleus TaxID=138277 RepID=A0ACC3B7Z2_9EURO|nr:hypothetical protein N8T08_002970 [Aspergillus melleus]